MPRILSAGKAIPITERARVGRSLTIATSRGCWSDQHKLRRWTSCGLYARFLRSQGPAYSRTIPNNPFAWAALSNSVTTRRVRFGYVVADAQVRRARYRRGDLKLACGGGHPSRPGRERGTCRWLAPYLAPIVKLIKEL
jgi:hypothetical protein